VEVHDARAAIPKLVNLLTGGDSNARFAAASALAKLAGRGES
jgi:HEAT repeat protein